MKPIYNMLKNSKVPDVQWQYIKAKLAYVQGRDLGRFVFKQARIVRLMLNVPGQR